MELTSSFFVDVTEGSRFYENIFVSGGALLADDNFLKTIQLGESMDSLHLHARGGERKVEGMNGIGRKRIDLNRTELDRK